jgi:hypothetical protein
LRAAPPLTRNFSRPPSALLTVLKAYGARLTPVKRLMKPATRWTGAGEDVAVDELVEGRDAEEYRRAELLEAVADASEVVLDREVGADERRQHDGGDERQRVVQRQDEQ